MKRAFLTTLLIALLGCSAPATPATVVAPTATPRPSVVATPAPEVVAIGQEGRIDGGEGKKIALAIDDKSMDALNKAMNAKDNIGYAQLIGAGQVFVVDSGTKALVIDSDWFRLQVRVLDGIHATKSGWLPMEWVVR